MAVITTPVVIDNRTSEWQVHREDCRDVQPCTTGGWDIADWADLVDQVFDGDEEAARTTRIMPCVGPIPGR